MEHTVSIQTVDLLVLTPCGLVIGYQKSGGTWCLKMTIILKTEVSVRFDVCRTVHRNIFQ